MLTVLIVDDQPREVEGIRRLIPWEEHGLTIAGTANDGRAGIRQTLALSPDIIITDIIMPGMDGLSMLDDIKRTGSEASIICISCFDDFKFISTALNKGATGYVLKPILAGELLQVVLRACAERRASASLRAFETRYGGFLANPRVVREAAALRLLSPASPSETDALLRAADWPNSLYIAALSPEAGCARDLLVADLDAMDAVFCALPECGCILFPIRGREDVAAIQTALRRMMKALSKDHGLAAYAGVYAPCEAGGLPAALACAMRASCFAFALGPGSVALYEELPAMPPPSPNHLLQEIQDLLLREDDRQLSAFLSRTLPESLPRDAALERGKLVLTLLYASLPPGQAHGGAAFAACCQSLQECAGRAQIADLIREVFDGRLSQDGDAGRVVRQVKEYVETHLSEDIDADTAIEGLYLSAGHANVLFKSVTGLTIRQYIQKQRLAYAAHLLRSQPHMRIYEVAWRAGYHDAAYFVNVFRRAYRLPPAQYRAMGSQG